MNYTPDINSKEALQLIKNCLEFDPGGSRYVVKNKDERKILILCLKHVFENNSLCYINRILVDGK